MKGRKREQQRQAAGTSGLSIPIRSPPGLAPDAWISLGFFRYHNQGERFAEAFRKAEIPFDWLGRDRSNRKFQPSDDSVKILTMYSSKGLEFPVVFIPCLEAMPNPRFEVAEEAKLLYVAMTPAMDQLVLSHHKKSVFVDRLREALRKAA